MPPLELPIAPLPPTLRDGEAPRFAPSTPEQRLLAGLATQQRKV